MMSARFAHLFFFYYIISFNIIYEKSSSSWIEGAVLNQFLDWIAIEFGVQIIQAGIRSLAMKYPNLGYVY